MENRCSDAVREDRVLEERVERSKTDEESSSKKGREFLAATYEVSFPVLAGIRHRELWSKIPSSLYGLFRAPIERIIRCLRIYRFLTRRPS